MFFTYDRNGMCTKSFETYKNNLTSSCKDCYCTMCIYVFNHIL